MKSPIYYGFLLLVCGFVLPACIHVHPGQSAFAQEHDFGADEDRDTGHGDDRADQQVQHLIEQLERLHQEIGRVEKELEQLHQRQDRGEVANRDGRGRSDRLRERIDQRELGEAANREGRKRSERGRQQRNRANRGGEEPRRDARMPRMFITDGDQPDAAPMVLQRAIRIGQPGMRPGRGAAGMVPGEMGADHHVEVIVDLDRSAPAGRMMGSNVPGNSDHGVFIVRGAAQGGAQVRKDRRGARGRGQQEMNRRATMGRGGMAMRGRTMGRGAMSGRGQVMGRGAMAGRGQMMDRGKMMGFVQSVEGHLGIAMPMNHGAGLICANCQGSTFIGGDRTAFGNVLKECQNGCSEGDACPRCAGKDDGQGQRRIIKRVMRFDGDLDDVNLHLEHGGDFQFGESGNAKVIMIHADDFDGELPDEIRHLLDGVEGAEGSTSDIEVYHFGGDEDGERVFEWKMVRPDGNRERQGDERHSEMQFEIQINSDGDMPIDIQRILKQIGGNHEGSGEIEIHTIIEHDGNKDEQVIEWNGDIDEIPAAIQEIIDDLEGRAIQFGGGEGHGRTILIEKIAESDGKNKKAKAGKKKAAANKNKKNKKTKKPVEKKRNKANKDPLKNEVLTLNGRIVL